MRGGYLNPVQICFPQSNLSERKKGWKSMRKIKQNVNPLHIIWRTPLINRRAKPIFAFDGMPESTDSRLQLVKEAKLFVLSTYLNLVIR